MNFSIIAAADQNRGIGKNNSLPWHLSADLKHFAQTTKGGTVIMGRSTWESIPEKYKPFKDRLNIVLSTQSNYGLPEGVILASNLAQALEKAESMNPKNKTFVIGGARVFDAAVHDASCAEILLTEIDSIFDCDTFFPEIPAHFTLASKGETLEENGLKFRFQRYESA